MNKKLSTLLCAMALAAAPAFAVPALPGFHTVVQPDGTTLTIRQVGDEFLHFTLTDDGMLVVRDDAGRYNYGRVDNLGRVADTGIQAYDGKVRPASQKYLTQNIADLDLAGIEQVRRANGIGHRRPVVKSGMSRAPQTGLGRFENNFPLSGKVKGVIVLVEYQDVKFNTEYNQEAKDAKTYFTNMIREEGFSDYGGTGSAHDFFLQMSGGKFQPDFDVYGPITLSQKRAYYGGNNDANAYQMVNEAVKALDSTVDFSQYDNDNDNYVDFVFVIYAGPGEASGGPAESVWPHSSSVKGRSTVLADGKMLDKYACSNEWEAYNGQPDGVGTFCHEFSHVMGLPDLYTTNYGKAEYLTPGKWDVMDGGCYNNLSRTPPAYSIYERNALGWMDVDVVTGAANICLDHIVDSNNGVLINTEKDNEFFLFENRQNKGWDTFIPGHGMLIWHIDYNKAIFNGNSVNNNADHQYVDIIEPGGIADNTNWATMASYSWPGTTGKTSFTSATTPAFKSWSGTAIDLPITDITEDNGLITFKVAGGVKELDTPQPQVDPKPTATSFVASWSPVAGATDYRIYVRAIADASTKFEDTADMGSSATASLPRGWTSTTTDAYTTAGDYGVASPSLKFAAAGDQITSPVYSTDLQSLSFWYKAKSAIGSKLAVMANVNGYWQTLEEITLSTKQGVYENNALPAGTRQIAISYNRKVGAVAIDDIKVVGGSADMTVPAYYGVSTNGLTSMTVTNLPAGYSTFSYSVKALSDNNYSEESAPVFVTLDKAGVDDITVGTDEVVTVSGRVISVRTAANHVDVFDIYGRHLHSVNTTSGYAAIAVPSTGVYIVRAGKTATKVLVR